MAVAEDAVKDVEVFNAPCIADDPVPFSNSLERNAETSSAIWLTINPTTSNVALFSTDFPTSTSAPTRYPPRSTEVNLPESAVISVNSV